MCGIVGIADHREAAERSALGLFALQHRGQESAGIAVACKGELLAHRGMGLVSEVFSPESLAPLRGRASIGHVRYSTTGSSRLQNAQPLVMRGPRGPLAVAHNGNLTNAEELRRKLEERGSIFHTTTDSEVILHLIARHRGPIEDAVVGALRQVEGAFSLVFLSPGASGNGRVIAARDPWGFRPLVLGRLNGSPVFASETSALSLMRARFVRELKPGEVLIAEGRSLKSLKPFAPRPGAACVFEQVYFARPDSTIFGANVHGVRRRLGRELAREMRGVSADMVVPVPDSGIPAALGFSQESGIPFEMGFIRNHYIGRTFIQPQQSQRERSVEMKLHPIQDVLRGKRIVLVDDSIVRGTTSRRIIRMLRRCGVRAIHMAVSSPPIVAPCRYGINTPEAAELIAANMSLGEIRRYLGVDSLHYLSLEAMLRAASDGAKGPAAPGPGGFCTACFTGRYPTLESGGRPGGRA